MKHFVLPMFDNAPSAKLGRRLGTKPSSVQKGSIYGELKLSEQLHETLGQVRGEVTRLTESLEVESQKNLSLQKELRMLKLKYRQKQQEMNVLAHQAKKKERETEQLSNFVASFRANNDVVLQMADFNDRMRRRYQHELQACKSELDQDKNQMFQLEQNKKYYTVKYEVLEEQFRMLFNSIETISNAKNLEDKHDA